MRSTNNIAMSASTSGGAPARRNSISVMPYGFRPRFNQAPIRKRTAVALKMYATAGDGSPCNCESYDDDGSWVLTHKFDDEESRRMIEDYYDQKMA